MDKKALKALYLPGGGARGAYQAGVLKAIGEILSVRTLPFDIVSGVSIGSINAAILVENAQDFAQGVKKLEALWQGIRCENVFDASNYALGKSVLRNLSHLIVKQRQSGFLLNTAPLREFIQNNVDFNRIQSNLENRLLNTLEIMCHCYEKQQTISFYGHHQPNFEDWDTPRHASQRTTFKMEHILASGALPLFFPAVNLDNYHYGDGNMGLISPLRGVLRCQAEKVLIISTRHPAQYSPLDNPQHSPIGFAQVLGSMLNSLFVDNLNRDIEIVNRMNEIARMIALWNKRRAPWRPVETLVLRPQINLSTIAQDQYESMPTLLRFLLNILGAKSHSGDLLSFLLFEKEFTCELINLGYEDTIKQEATIKQFFE